MKLLKTESPYLTKDQWRKVFLAMSIMTLILYIVAMVFSLCGSKVFIMNYQNDQMDRIESFMRAYNIFSLITIALTSLEFFIILSFILNKLASLYYVLIYYALAAVITLVFPQQAFVISYFYPFLFYFSVPLIEQLLINKKNHLTFGWKKYFKHLLRLLIAIATTLSLQAMITVIKAGYFDGKNHVLSLSGYFIYTLEYEIALSVILFTVSLFINREKGDSLWANGQDHGGSSQTSMM